MSLINDALKRAKESQKQPPIAGGGSPFVAVDAAPRSGVNWAIFVIAIALLAAAFLFIGMALAKHKESPALTAANNLAPAVVAPTKVVTVTQQVEKIVYKPAPAPAAPPDKPPVPSTAASADKPLPPMDADTDPDQRIRVQAIFYSAQNPTAIVNGRSVGLNAVLEKEKVRIKAILPSSILVERNDGTVKKIFLGE